MLNFFEPCLLIGTWGSLTQIIHDVIGILFQKIYFKQKFEMGDPFNAIFKNNLVEKRKEKSYFLGWFYQKLPKTYETHVPFFCRVWTFTSKVFCWPTPMRNTKQVYWNLPDDTATVLSLDDPLHSLLLPPPPPLLPAKGQVLSLTLFFPKGFIQSTIK